MNRVVIIATIFLALASCGKEKSQIHQLLEKELNTELQSANVIDTIYAEPLLEELNENDSVKTLLTGELQRLPRMVDSVYAKVERAQWEIDHAPNKIVEEAWIGERDFENKVVQELELRLNAKLREKQQLLLELNQLDMYLSDPKDGIAYYVVRCNRADVQEDYKVSGSLKQVLHM